MSDAGKIAIVGGGIGGIAAAVALHRIDREVVVYEKASALREAGTGMMLWPNATRILREWGLLDQVIAQSGPNTNFQVRTRAGEVLMDLALGQFEVPAVCIRRRDVLKILLSALPPENIRTSCELTGLTQDAGKVRLTFRHGMEEEVHEHQAVIAADGIRSIVRGLLFDSPAPVFHGYTVWRGLAEYPGDEISPGCNSETWGAGNRFGMLQTGHQQFTWYATANGPRDQPDAAEGRKRELLQLFAGWHAPIPALIAASDEAGILKNGAFDLPPLRRWAIDRVTLLGDAAHTCTPNLGQGGCMALEDAQVLAKSLARDPDPATAFRHYETLRRPRTRGIQQRSRLMGWIGQWQHPAFVAARGLVTRFLPPALIERNLRRVYSYQA